MKSVYHPLKFKPLLALILVMTWHSSCNDWVDIEPENELIKQEFWKTSDDIMSVMAATYNALRRTTERSFLLGEVRADFIYVTSALFADYARIGVNDITPTNDKVKWKDYYNTINLANTVMFYAPLVQDLDKTLTDEILQQMESEMLFLRSLSYFYIVRLWKEAPLVLFPTVSDTVEFYYPKSTEPVILKQIVEDLKRASALSSDHMIINNSVPFQGRGNKYAIQALLADIFLWQENYSGCLAYCDSIINSGRFNLENKIDWFKLYYPGNSIYESIFEIQYDDRLEGQENPMYENNLISSLRVDIDKIAYDEDNDIRFCDGWGSRWKYIGKDETGMSSRSRTDSERDANFIYYRYAEVLLMKAEALAETGSFEEANYLVRQVAERAGVTHNPTFSITSFRTALLTERGRELGAEGKRWFDILRFSKKNNYENKKLIMDILLGKATDANELAIMRSKVIDTMSYYLPVHEAEILYNKNMVQNPFYDR
jgi:hypothetical protein